MAVMMGAPLDRLQADGQINRNPPGVSIPSDSGGTVLRRSIASPPADPLCGLFVDLPTGRVEDDTVNLCSLGEGQDLDPRILTDEPGVAHQRLCWPLG